MDASSIARHRRRSARGGSGLLARCALLLAVACAKEESGGGPALAEDVHPVLVVAVDGLDPDLLMHFLGQGDLPTLRKMMREGVAGRLETLYPTWSPVIWTTVATGKDSSQHGINHFAWSGPDGVPRLFTSGHRATKALWNVVSDAGGRVDVVGWWNTWPAEPVNGTVVAQVVTRNQLQLRGGRNALKGTLRPGIPDQVYPAEWEEEFFALAERWNDPAFFEAALFRDLVQPRQDLPDMPELLRRLWVNVQKSYRADSVYRESMGRLLERDPDFDLAMVYFGCTDVASHRFWRHMRPQLYDDPPSDEEVEDFGDLIRNTYLWVDQALAELLGKVPADTNVVLLSDHGFHAINRRHTFDEEEPPDDVNSGDHQDSPQGVFFAMGPDFRVTRTPEDQPLATIGRVQDVAPTLLNLLGLPAGEDMIGRVLEDLLTGEHLARHPPRTIPTHDDAEWRAGVRERLQIGVRMEEELAQGGFREEELGHLREIGYPIGSDPERGGDRDADGPPDD